jgi:hypothetical protein
MSFLRFYSEEDKHMNKFTNSKAVVLVLVLALVLSMTCVSFATSGAPNLVCYSEYTEEATTNDTVYLQVSPANSSYTAVGYDTAQEAVDDVTWTVPVRSGLVSVGTVTGVAITIDSETKYVCQAEVTTASSGYGAASILATAEDDGYTNFTVVVEKSGTAADADATAYIITDGEEFIVTNSAVTATAGEYGYATPVTTLNSLINTSTTEYDKYINAYTINSYGNYVDSITGYDELGDPYTLTEGYVGTYTGWMYRVYSDGTMVDASEIIGASAYDLHDDDVVVWYYGTYSDALTFFDNWDN